MNVVGAAGFIVNGWWHGALPSAALNIIWMMIGAIALMARIVDLSHVIRGHGDVKGLPGPAATSAAEQSAAN